jgi:phosphate transport system substrate-binding protein
LTSSNQLLNPYKPGFGRNQCAAHQPPQLNLQALRDPEYPKKLVNTLYVVVKKDGSKAQVAGEAYAALLQTEEGRSLLEEAGFLAIDN